MIGGHLEVMILLIKYSEENLDILLENINLIENKHLIYDNPEMVKVISFVYFNKKKRGKIPSF